MKFKVRTFVIPLLLFILTCTVAYAGILDSAKGWLLENGILALSGLILSIGVISYYTGWLSSIGVNVGYFIIACGQIIVTVSLSLFDRKITKEEVTAIRANITEIKRSFTEMVKAAKEKPAREG